MNNENLTVVRGDILHLLDDPSKVQAATGSEDASYEFFEDGLLIIESGLIKAVGSAEALLPTLPADVEIQHYPKHLITPGFVDTHIHFPQTEMIGSYGEQLLEWLNTYTFPTEKQFSDETFAAARAEFFLNQLLSNGTTTALVFGSVHAQSVDAFFQQAEQLKLRMICGKVLMDRNAPDYLTDTAESGYQESKKLIEKWHGRDRLQYAITPRFAPTCSKEQLTRAGELLQEHPGVYMQTHLSENEKEVAWVKELFPDAEHYLDAYDHANLLGKRSVFAHCIHLCDHEYDRLAESQSNISFCPTSNLFLGSCLFDLKRAERHNVSVGLGTDVGAGTSFSLLQTLNEAYKVQQLRGDKLTPLKSFYLATLAGAKALDIDDKIGNFQPGKEADFVALDYNATPLLSLRMQHCQSIVDKLFAFAILGDDRAIAATHILGKKVHSR